MPNFYPPTFNKKDFNCPHCGVYAHQDWFPAVKYGLMVKSSLPTYDDYEQLEMKGSLDELGISKCYHCKKLVIWYKESMLIPGKMIVPLPAEYLPENIREIYTEAGKVLDGSARASGALMRLALELLLQQINNNQLKLYQNIIELSKQKIPDKIIKAMSILRVNGNDIMHTGEIKLFENRDQVLYLFELFNMIVEEMIDRIKKVDQAYKRIPESVRKEIEKM